MSTVMSRLPQTLASMSTILAILTSCSEGEIFSIDPIVSSGAVLQQQSLLTISARATPGTHIKITTDWDFSVTSSTGVDSTWHAEIRTPAADTLTHQLTISSPNLDHFVSNILIGEVWLTADQTGTSPLPHSFMATSDTQDSSAVNLDWLDDNLVRIFQMEPGISSEPTSFAEGKWVRLSEGCRNTLNLTAACLAKVLRDSLNIPVGVISVSNGGSPCRAWVSPELDTGNETLNEASEWESKHNDLNDWLSTLPTINTSNPDGTDALPTTSVFDEVINNCPPDISEWHTLTLPGLWEHQGLAGFDGLIWLIKEVKLPRECARHNAKLYIGNLADNDLTYVNHTLVGSKSDTSSWSEPGVYNIPRSTLKTRTTIAIRLNGHHTSAGIFGPTDGTSMRLEIPDINFSTDISGQWAYVAAAKFSTDNNKLYLLGVPDNRYMVEFRGYDSRPNTHRGVVYNKMLTPLRGIPFAGATCHFGEADMNKHTFAESFTEEAQRFVTTLRLVANKEKLPVIFNQPPPPPQDKNNSSSLVRTSLVTAANKAGADVYVVSLADLGTKSEFNSMPRRQVEEGWRDARTILATVYGHSSPDNATSPLPRFATTDLQVVNIEFAHAHKLSINVDLPSAFEIAGEDSVFFPAKALASGNWVTMFSHMVLEPRFARYAWSDTVMPTLSGDGGMPAPAFCLRCQKTDEK